METNYYRNFIIIVESGSITSAAEVLHTTQPTLSKQMQVLENMLQTELLVTKRGAKFMRLTAAGEILYKRLKELCSVEDLMLNELASATNRVEGVLRFSIAPGRSERFIQRVLHPFHERYPNVIFELNEGIITTQEEQLLLGRTEIGICNVELTQPEKFEILCTRAEHLALVASSNFQNFPRKHQIKWSDLRDVPVAISGGCAVALEKLYGDIKQELNVVSISTSKQTALAWIETNRVAAIVPLEKGELMRSDLQIAYLQSNMSLEKSIVRVKNRSLSYVAEVFLDFYKELES